MLGSGSIRLVFTTGLDPDGVISRHVALHGDGLRDVALRVPDARQAFLDAVRCGATPIAEPVEIAVGNSKIVRSAVALFDNVIHSFIQRDDRNAVDVMEGVSLTPSTLPPRSALYAVDHMAIALSSGELEKTISLYKSVFGLKQIHEVNIRTEHTAMNSKVLVNPSGTLKLAMMEPGPGKRPGQVDEFLQFNRGPGVQHLAFLTHDIRDTAITLRHHGISFLQAPESYYEGLAERVGEFGFELETLKNLRILVARDSHGLLYQAFTKPIHSRPTFFTEVIERDGARGFGEANVNALFRALEREQMRRRTESGRGDT